MRPMLVQTTGTQMQCSRAKERNARSDENDIHFFIEKPLMWTSPRAIISGKSITVRRLPLSTQILRVQRSLRMLRRLPI